METSRAQSDRVNEPEKLSLAGNAICALVFGLKHVTSGTGAKLNHNLVDGVASAGTDSNSNVA